MTLSRISCLLMGASTMALATTALAQAPAAPGAEVEEVIVTGSRIARSGFDAPTPMTAITPQEMKAKAVVTLVEVLNDLPALRPNQNTGSATNVGSSNFNLRSLGASRTLVLVDGRRFPDTSPAGGVDINVLPAALVNRFEVVTGGAAAAYGSDAVAGVVNVFLDSSLKGGKADLQYTVTKYGDRPTYSLDLAQGFDFQGGRGHVVVAGGVYRNPETIVAGDRPWGDSGYTQLTNPAYTATNGQFRLLNIDNARFSQMTTGGLITSNGPLKNIQFGAGGVQSLFRLGTVVGTTWMKGGDGFQPQPLRAIVSPKSSRNNAFAHVTYDLTDNVQAFAEGLYSRISGTQTNNWNYNNADITIRRDNAFLPANILQTMVANNLQTITMGRLNLETGLNTNTTTQTLQRYVTGLKGKFADKWSWDADVQYTHNHYFNVSDGNRDQQKWLNALDSVLVNGVPTCRSTITNPTNGCLPANIFGENMVSQGSAAYAEGTSFINYNLKQLDAAANLRGDLFEGWAGPISAAAGVEYKHDKVDLESDAVSAAAATGGLGWRQASSVPYTGKVGVKEIYGEVLIPLLNDAPLAKHLELDLASRYVDYTTTGSTAVWKIGGNWNVNDQVRFRATYSRDFRAPNTDDLFAGATLRGGANVIDRTTNTTTVISTRSAGNPLLKPEKSKTLVYGIVLEPAFIPRLHGSVDVFDIRIKDALSSVTTQQTEDFCFAGDASYCAKITRSPATNAITLIESTQFNAAQFKTNGIDFELAYSLPLDGLPGNLPGTVSFRSLTTYTAHFTTISVSGLKTDTSGQVGADAHWRSALTTSYANGPLSLRLQANYFGPGVVDNTYGAFDIGRETAVPGVYVSALHWPSRTYLNTSVQYEINERVQVYGKVNNLLNSYPFPIPSSTITRADPAALGIFDRLGRTYGIGLRLKW